jgi:excisionase family DNA binding protein
MSSRLEAAVAELAAAIEERVEAATRTNGGPTELLSVEEAARQLGIGRTALYHEFTDNRLRSVKVGRRRLIPSSEIDAYINARVAEDPLTPVAGFRTVADVRSVSR